MGRVIVPFEDLESGESLIFLAGPIQGAEDWQSQAIKIIHSLNPQINIASPRRENILEIDKKDEKEAQIDWETKYLNHAGKRGVILFWLAKEKIHMPSRAYAQTSRFELAEWKVKHERGEAEIVIGIEDGFTNARYIKRRFEQDSPDVHILSTLQSACERAVDLLVKK